MYELIQDLPYFVHTLSLVTDNIPFLNHRKKENDDRKYFMFNLHESIGPDRTHDPCIINRTHHRLLYMAKSFWGSYFILIDPESVNSVFALFDCFGAILYELLIAGLIDMVYQSGAYEAFAGFLVNKGNGIYFRGTEEEMPNFEGNRDNIGEQGI